MTREHKEEQEHHIHNKKAFFPANNIETRKTTQHAAWQKQEVTQEEQAYNNRYTRKKIQVAEATKI